MAASRAWCSATWARSTPDSSGVGRSLLMMFTVSYRRPTDISELLPAGLRARCTDASARVVEETVRAGSSGAGRRCRRKICGASAPVDLVWAHRERPLARPPPARAEVGPCP
ncbi:hypothetical protein [Streptomyces sp. CC224B]|uniref:hypothetical protein n=1 Tax=Streptomyces sp. CC224B TaxID=3044571 RepID=UPI0024A84A52|nr:hypothetical protein [Streptomyces sp. CC224B]